METDIQKVLARMAQMETELSTLRASRGPAPKQFDESEYVRQLAQRITQNPLGVLAEMGVPVDHVTRVAVVNALGDKATPEQRMLAQLGPQISTTQQLAHSIDSLSRQVSEIQAGSQRAGVKDSLNKLIADKAKYPSLSKAYAADPSLFESDIAGHKGSAEDLANSLEVRAKQFASAFGVAAQPASDGNAETPADPSMQVAPAGNVIDVPPLPKPQQGLFTDEDHAKLKAEILQKYPDKPAQ